jgi:hypothetical protein
MTRDPDLKYCAQGHLMTILGGANCGCYPEASCSVPVFSCRECGDSDYGDNEIARLKKDMCEEARECAKKAPTPEELQPLHLSKAEFSALDEYSATHPTGVVIGKRWRRHDGAYDPSCKNPVWIIGEYVALFDRDDCAMIKWYVPVIRIDAPLSGDAP